MDPVNALGDFLMTKNRSISDRQWSSNYTWLHKPLTSELCLYQIYLIWFDQIELESLEGGWREGGNPVHHAMNLYFWTFWKFPQSPTWNKIVFSSQWLPWFCELKCLGGSPIFLLTVPSQHGQDLSTHLDTSSHIITAGLLQLASIVARIYRPGQL